jgi:hypothetical protein
VPGISRLVEVQFGTVTIRSRSAVLPLRWQAAGARRVAEAIADPAAATAPEAGIFERAVRRFPVTAEEA